MKILKNITIIFLLFSNLVMQGQAVPALVENIPFLVTFGADAKRSHGDDDYCQTFFFSVPKSYSKPVYIRIFDPNIGGMHDELKGSANTKMSFELYGGKGCITEPDARATDPKGKYKSGNLLHSKTFGSESQYDNKWYTIGPLSPNQGEMAEAYFGHVFKLICEGKSGNDGNLYKYFLSSSPNSNVAIPGGNAFTFEYSFRLHADPNQISHIYPFVDKQVISIKQTNFDFDADGTISLYSVATKGYKMKMSGENEFVESKYEIVAREKGTSLDIQLKKGTKKLERNNVVFYVTNQYGEAMPFYTVPIGGVPKYKGKLSIKSSIR